MYFTEKELKRINELLEESRELQRKNGNKTYSMEEVCRNLGIPVPTKNKTAGIIMEEESEYYRN